MVKRRDISNSHLLDIDALVNTVINSGLSPDVFEVEVDLPRAKNVVDFALGPSFLNIERLFAKQLEQAVKLFAEYCPECSNVPYLNEVPTEDSVSQFLGNVQLLEFSICPKCQKNKKELFKTYPNELVSCLGQRSGKTALAGGVIFPYILHRFLKITNPTRYLGLMPNTMLQMTMVAVTATQAYETLWLATSGTIKSAPWFKEYHKALREEEKIKGLTPGSLISVLDTFIWYGNKKISVTYQAADGKALRGRTRIAAGIDELAHFNSSKSVVRANPEETYTALDNSLRTVRNSTDALWAKGDYDVPTAYMLNISSPRSQYDKMMRLLKQAETDIRKVAFHYASWEASPVMPRESLKSVEFSTPIIFWRDFGAQPPLADSPFMNNKNSIYNIKSNKNPVFTTKPIYVKDKAGNGKFIAAELTSCDIDKQTARIVTCDAGESGNCFAISLHHIETNDNETQIILDGTVSVAPEKIPELDSTVTVHFPTMFEIILQLSKNFNVEYVVYDRWQCVVGDTLVYTSDGIKKIKNLHEDQYGVFNLDTTIADLEGINKTTKWGKLKSRDLIEITTKNDYSITGTADHKLWTIDEDANLIWCKIGDLKTTDYLALKSPNLWAEQPCKQQYSESGYVTAKTAEIMAYLSDLDTSPSKEIPKEILESPKSLVVIYLKTLLGLRENTVISYYSDRSLIFLKQLQAILLNLGVFTNKISKAKSGLYRLTIANQHTLYKELDIKSSILDLEQKLNIVKNTEILPIGKVIQSWVQRHSIKLPKKIYTKKCISKKVYLEKIESLVLNTEPELAAKIAKMLPFYWTPIKSIQEAGVADVYDITVPKTSSFIANGIVSHNSTGEIQRLRDLKINAERYSPKLADFIELRGLVESESYKTPKWEYENLEDLDISNPKKLAAAPYTHLALQMATVQENGKKVLKPEEGDDDIFRTVVLATRYLLLHKSMFLKAGKGNVIKPKGYYGVVIGKSSGSSASFGGGSKANSFVGVVKRKTE
jgi:hypothetical protein